MPQTQSQGQEHVKSHRENQRRGLVLEGGGAKGAWQFGVLWALAKKGINFDVVSGTSVGALNGAICCAKRMDVGYSLWSSISFWQIFTLQPWLIGLVFIGPLAHGFHAFVNGYHLRSDSGEPHRYSRAVGLFGPLPLLAAGYAGDRFLICNDPRGHLLLVIVISSCCLWISIGWFKETVQGRNFMLVHMSAFLLIIPILLGKDFWRSPVWWTATAPFLLLIIAAGLRLMNLALFVPLPLRTRIDKIIENGLVTPLYVTAAKEVSSYFDPDDLVYIRDVGWAPGGLSGIDAQTMAWESSGLVPVYTRADNLNSHEVREALLASSALPFGFVPARFDRQKDRLVDGGVIDNTPWFPLVESYPCDEIIIVKCNPSAAWNDEEAKRQWQRRERLFRVIAAKFNPPEDGKRSTVKNIPPIEIPEREPTRWPRVFVISPHESLGSFICGTMNFSNAGGWMKEGYEEGMAQIEQQHIGFAPNLTSS